MPKHRVIEGPDPVDIHVGARVRAQRLLINMTQTDLAEALDLTFQQVQKYEKGTNRISASKLYHIANVLGVDPGFFFEGLRTPGTKRSRSIAEKTHDEIGSIINSPDAVQMMRAYTRIEDGDLRRGILGVAQSVQKHLKQ